MQLAQAISNFSAVKKLRGAASTALAVAARALFDSNNNVFLDADVPQEGKFRVVTPVTPVTAFSLSWNAKGQDELIYLTPAGTLATGTITFPTDAKSIIGQRISIATSQTQTALTVSSSGLTLKGTAITALTANAVPAVWQKVAAATWLRIQ